MQRERVPETVRASVWKPGCAAFDAAAERSPHGIRLERNGWPPGAEEDAALPGAGARVLQVVDQGGPDVVGEGQGSGELLLALAGRSVD